MDLGMAQPDDSALHIVNGSFAQIELGKTNHFATLDKNVHEKAQRVTGDKMQTEYQQVNSVKYGHLSRQEALDIVIHSAKRIEPYINKTPVLTSSSINEMAGQSLSLYFKCEMFQKTGSFKFRGAMNSVCRFAEDMSHSNVVGTPVAVTHSSGNHGQAVALAAKIMGMKSFIVTPTSTPSVKKLASAEYGATVVECKPSEECRRQTASAILTEHFPLSRMILSYQNTEIIATQGTAALELLQQEPFLDAIVAPVGSGGLLAGTCMAAKGMNPNIKVYGAEPQLANDCAQSFKSGRRITFSDYPKTIAEGLKVNMAENTWPIIRDDVEDIITVREDDIARAMEMIWKRMKLVVETSGAVSLAAVLTSQFKERGHKNVGIILSGGNVDIQNLPWNK